MDIQNSQHGKQAHPNKGNLTIYARLSLLGSCCAEMGAKENKKSATQILIGIHRTKQKMGISKMGQGLHA